MPKRKQSSTSTSGTNGFKAKKEFEFERDEGGEKPPSDHGRTLARPIKVYRAGYKKRQEICIYRVHSEDGRPFYLTRFQNLTYSDGIWRDRPWTATQLYILQGLIDRAIKYIGNREAELYTMKRLEGDQAVRSLIESRNGLKHIALNESIRELEKDEIKVVTEKNDPLLQSVDPEFDEIDSVARAYQVLEDLQSLGLDDDDSTD